MTKLSFRSALALLPTLLFICLPLVTLAQNRVGDPLTNPVGDPLTNSVGGCTGTACKLVNPLSANNFCDLLKVVLDAILIIGMPIAVLFLVYVGFKFILARGNPEKLMVARQNLLYTIIGIAVFLGAWTIAKIIQATLVNLGASAAKAC